MWQQLWQIVLGTLFADTIGGCDEDIGQEAWLRWGDVCKPATHDGTRRNLLSDFWVVERVIEVD